MARQFGWAKARRRKLAELYNGISCQTSLDGDRIILEMVSNMHGAVDDVVRHEAMPIDGRPSQRLRLSTFACDRDRPQGQDAENHAGRIRET